LLNTAPRQNELVPLDAIDLFDVDRYRHSSQHPAWHALRQSAPLWPQTGDGGITFWSVTRYQDVLSVIKNHRDFSSEYGTILAVLDGDSAGGRAINLMDPPRHGGIRVPTMRLLSTAAVQRGRTALRTRVRAIVDECRDGGELDVVPLVMRLAMAAIGDIVGVPAECWDDVARWTMTGVAPTDPAYSLGSVEETLRTVHFELFTMFQDLVRERRTRPRRDIISVLLDARIDGRALTFDEVVLNCYSFVMGANTTTPHVAAQLLLALAERPEQWRALRADPGLVDTAVEEGVRWATPTNHLLRRTNTAVELAGQRLGPGELVCAWVASANRDETVFADPYEFDITRRPNPHIGFGNGIHYCNGAPGARMVIDLFLRELVAAVADLAVAGPVEHLRSNFINGITSLPVTMTAARTSATATAGGCPVAHGGLGGTP